MSKVKTFKIEIIDTDGDIKTTVSIDGYSTLEIYGIQSMLHSLVEDALDEADMEAESELENEVDHE
jgi:hypothetical protein